MQRAGVLAKRFGVHADTIRDWADQFGEFFSEGAQKEAGSRREFTFEDEVVLNTIHEFRRQRYDFEQIRAALVAGERNAALPPNNEPVPQESQLAVYTEMKELRVIMQQKDAEIERLRREGESRLEDVKRLEREVGKWQGKYEELKERLDAE